MITSDWAITEGSPSAKLHHWERMSPAQDPLLDPLDLRVQLAAGERGLPGMETTVLGFQATCAPIQKRHRE